MKKNISIALVWLFCFGASVNGVYSQVANSETLIDQVATRDLKPPKVTSQSYADKVRSDVGHTRAANHFKKHYRNHEEKWADGVDCITAGYSDRSEKTLVYYNKKGRWVACLKSYGEEKLPGAIRQMIKDEYCGYKVHGAYEVDAVEATDYPIYVALLENDKKIKEVVVQNDQMRLAKEYDKSPES